MNGFKYRNGKLVFDNVEPAAAKKILAFALSLDALELPGEPTPIARSSDTPRVVDRPSDALVAQLNAMHPGPLPVGPPPPAAYAPPAAPPAKDGAKSRRTKATTQAADPAPAVAEAAPPPTDPWEKGELPKDPPASPPVSKAPPVKAALPPAPVVNDDEEEDAEDAQDALAVAAGVPEDDEDEDEAPAPEPAKGKSKKGGASNGSSGGTAYKFDMALLQSMGRLKEILQHMQDHGVDGEKKLLEACRAIRADVPVLTRISDADLSNRVQRTFAVIAGGE